jgi:hypothetical protein
MTQTIENTKLRCLIGGDEKLIYIKIDLLDGLNQIITTLEYSEITKYFNELLIVNEENKAYDNLEELKTDLSQARLYRFLNKGKGNQKLENMVELVAKIKHQNGDCKDDCVFCNPDLGTDHFPDFNFSIKNNEPEGNA